MANANTHETADYRLKMPDVGEGVVEAEIVEWKVKIGDVVEEDDDLVDVMTDKATVEIPSPISGTITALTGQPGDMIPVGTEIVVISPHGASADTSTTAETTGHRAEDNADQSAISDQPAATPLVPASPPQDPVETIAHAEPVSPTTSPIAPPALGHAATARTGPVLASPAVRQRARDNDITLDAVPGSGPAGRVTHQDLDDFIAAGGRIMVHPQSRQTEPGQTGSHPAPVNNHARQPQTGSRETKIIGLRRKIAQNMQAAWSIPHITYAEEVDVTDVEALRQTLNAARTPKSTPTGTPQNTPEQPEQPKLTMLPFLLTALVRALADVPQANAHYDAEAGTLTEFDGVHAGIATATEKGLVVPVLRHAESLDVWAMAGEIRRLASACRDGTAGRNELSGSTITITSLGAMGGVVTTPILNPPETAIIGVNKITERPAFDHAGRVVPRQFMTLSSSFDHRIVDGYDAATLIQRVKSLLETPATLFM